MYHLWKKKKKKMHVTLLLNGEKRYYNPAPVSHNSQHILSSALSLYIRTFLRNFGFIWIAAGCVAAAFGFGSTTAMTGHAGSRVFTFISNAYNFFTGKKSFHVERNLKRDCLVFSSTY